jgi:hypothetical protein
VKPNHQQKKVGLRNVLRQEAGAQSILPPAYIALTEVLTILLCGLKIRLKTDQI